MVVSLYKLKFAELIVNGELYVFNIKGIFNDQELVFNGLPILIFILLIVVVPTVSFAAVEDYLILQDIGSYKYITQVTDLLTDQIKQITGHRIREHPGTIISSGHFYLGGVTK